MDENETAETQMRVVGVDGRQIDVSIRVSFDEIEYVGRLWFTDRAAPTQAIADRAALPGRTPAEAVALAQRLSDAEVTQRYRRAVAERRRYHALRQVTGEILAKVRRLNRVSTSMRAGLMGTAAAAREIAVAESDLHDLVDRIREVAGAEDGDPDPPADAA